MRRVEVRTTVKKADLSKIFPEPDVTRQRMAREYPALMKCPRGHVLPHRLMWGRCNPLECVDHGEPGTTKSGHDKSLSESQPYRREMELLPRGLEKVARVPAGSPEEAILAEARAEEAVEVMRMIGIQAARQAIHPLPELPEAPSLKDLGPRDYVKQRLQDIAPLALERQVFDMLYNPTSRGREAAEELLDRAGYPRKPEQTPNFRGPVVFVQNVVNIPYEKQKVINGGSNHVEEAYRRTDWRGGHIEANDGGRAEDVRRSGEGGGSKG